jgi:sphingolipid delta-4 desaturase
MGAKVSRTDFAWVGSDEPHATRRKLILAKYPEVKSLMGVDPRFKFVVSGLVLLQILTFYLMKDVTSRWTYLLVAYFFTGVINHSLMLAVHEIAHGQAFGPNRVFANKIFGMFANLPIGFPMSISFKKYHLKHHRYQGDDFIDTDIPSKFETRFFINTFTKFFWVTLQPFFYSFRPFLVYPLPPEAMEGVNWIVQLVFNYAMYSWFGLQSIWLMCGGSVLAMGLHPVAGHFISEHYIMFKEEETKDEESEKFGVSASSGKFLVPETCSYYGPLNMLTFNVGYHVEHHDFPSIPGRRLPEVRKIAPEFYDNLHYHSSWTYVLYKYITDPSVGPYARVKRPHRDTKVDSTESCNGKTQLAGDEIKTEKIKGL